MIDEKVSAMLAETPAKVMTLLCVAMASMAFLFIVSATNASFTGTPMSVPNPINPSKLMTMVDYTAAGYSSFLQQNLFRPVQQSVAMTTSNVSWIASNAAYALGIGQGNTTPMVSEVAGAHIVAPPVQSAAKPASPPTSDATQGVFSPILALLTQ